MLEVHAVDAGDQCRRKEDERGPGEELHRGVLLDADEAQGSIQQESEIVAQKGAVVRERLCIAEKGLNVAPNPLRFGRPQTTGRQEEAQHSGGADRSDADVREKGLNST